MVSLNIFTGDKKILKEEIESLLKLIESTNIKSLPAYQTVESMIYFYELLATKETNYFETLLKMNYEEVLAVGRRMEDNKIQNIITTRKEHENLLSLFNHSFEELDSFVLEEENNIEKVPNEKEMYEIISDFFRDCNKKAALLFDFLIKGKRIFELPKEEEEGKAYNLFNIFQNNFYIFIKNNGNIVTTMTRIVHEIGHAMDELQFLSLGERKQCNYYTNKSSLVEVISTIYEKEFLDFLLEKGIYKEYAQQEMKVYFSSLRFFAEQADFLFYLPNDLLKMDNYKNVSKQDLIKYLEDYCSLLVDHDAMYDPSDLDLCDALKCYYGFALSSYFTNLKKQDSQQYQENFHNFLKLRAGYFPSNFLERMGTTPQELTNIVRADCEKFSSKIIIKK